MVGVVWGNAVGVVVGAVVGGAVGAVATPSLPQAPRDTSETESPVSLGPCCADRAVRRLFHQSWTAPTILLGLLFESTAREPALADWGGRHSAVGHGALSNLASAARRLFCLLLFNCWGVRNSWGEPL